MSGSAIAWGPLHFCFMPKDCCRGYDHVRCPLISASNMRPMYVLCSRTAMLEADSEGALKEEVHKETHDFTQPFVLYVGHWKKASVFFCVPYYGWSLSQLSSVCAKRIPSANYGRVQIIVSSFSWTPVSLYQRLVIRQIPFHRQWLFVSLTKHTNFEKEFLSYRDVDGGALGSGMRSPLLAILDQIETSKRNSFCANTRICA